MHIRDFAALYFNSFVLWSVFVLLVQINILLLYKDLGYSDYSLRTDN